MAMEAAAATQAHAQSARRLSIGFLNWAHAIDHFVMLIYPTVVISLQVTFGRSYAELIALGTASFVAFGLFSLPAGWLADRWSRRNMMVAFYIGCGVALTAAAFAPTLAALAVALCMLGMFAAIYHPVGTAMVIEQAATAQRGRSLAFNGVCGNIGAALAAGVTAALISIFGWRSAFLIPAVLCVATGLIYPWFIPDDRHHVVTRKSSPDVRLPTWVAASIFGLFIVVALSAGLAFNTISVALPKIVDERLDIPLYAVGGVATAVFMCGALAQLAVGRLVEWIAPHILFAVLASLQFVGVLWAAYAHGPVLLAALALTMAAAYGQVTVNDLVIARYTADAWRGRVYAVRYFLTFLVSGAAVSMIAVLYSRGGFDLVLGTTAVVSFGFVIAVIMIALLANSVERARVVQPAE
jgi:MFS family permease